MFPSAPDDPETIAHEIGLVGGESGETAVFLEAEAADGCRISCRYRGKEITATATDFFTALCQVRSLLEREGLRPVCYGASLNVYPSPMARDMGPCLKAYRMTMGQVARTSDLVRIFNTGADVRPSTVGEQEQFYLDWLAAARS